MATALGVDRIAKQRQSPRDRLTSIHLHPSLLGAIHRAAGPELLVHGLRDAQVDLERLVLGQLYDAVATPDGGARVHRLPLFIVWRSVVDDGAGFGGVDAGIGHLFAQVL